MVRYRYDAWGNLLYGTPLTQCIAANHNPFIYKGYMYDEETGWYYLQSRYYVPSLCRFLSPDSIDYADPETIGGLNLYAYCDNDPINKYDPSGHLGIITTMVIGVAVGAVIAFGSAYASDVAENIKKDGFQWSDLNTFKDNWKHYIGVTLGGAISGAGIGLCTFLGASVGVAVSTGVKVIALTGGKALAIGLLSSFVAGGLGNLVKVAISDQETFQLNDIFIDATANMFSGLLSFTGAMVGGIMGVKNPETKFDFSKTAFKNIALYQVGLAAFGVYTVKAIIAYIKKKLKELF